MGFSNYSKKIFSIFYVLLLSSHEDELAGWLENQYTRAHTNMHKPAA